MKSSAQGRGPGLILWSVVCSLWSVVPALADTHYVNATNAIPRPPYTNWVDAATVIQDAVDAAEANDTVLVSDGAYATGGRRVEAGARLVNRVAIDKPLTVRSLHGPEVTRIVGKGPRGDDAVRGVYLGDGALLAGFTVTNGYVRYYSSDPDGNGAGVYAQSEAGVVSNCMLIGNHGYSGGGVYQGTLRNCQLSGNDANNGGGACEATLYNCRLSGNVANFGGGTYGGMLYGCELTGQSALSGGGAYDGTLYNCTVTGNSAIQQGGGTSFATLINCIVYYNTASADANNYLPYQTSFSCTTPDPGGPGNLTNEPGIVSIDNPRLLADSRCIDGGTNQTWMDETSDLDGEGRIRAVVDIGSDEFWDNGLTGRLSVAVMAKYTQAVVGFVTDFEACVDGRARGYVWDFGDGQRQSNVVRVSHAYADNGVYSLVLAASNWTDYASATVAVTVVKGEYCVSTNGNDDADGLNWKTAKRTIQAAVDAAAAGGTVLVGDGAYATGGRCVDGGGLVNRVAIDKPLTVRSLHGPEATQIVGKGPRGDGAVRGVYLGDGALLAGFTVTDGYVRYYGSGPDGNGAGVYAQSEAGVVSNCMLIGNHGYAGGGVYQGTLRNCQLSGNDANNGGGACEATLYNCRLSGNVANFGGGTYGGMLYGCELTGQSALSGGGAYDGTLYNCTVTGNSAIQQGGGTSFATLINCIVYYNTASADANNYLPYQTSFSCTTPDPGGLGNITNPPAFVDAAAKKYNLNAASPCVDAGLNQSWMFGAKDVDSTPRIINGTVDLGAFETPFYADLRSLFQGAYNTGTHRMTTALGPNLPVTAPYAADARKVSAVQSNITDWVQIELQNTNHVTVASQSVFLDEDGHVLSTDGRTGVVVDVSAGDNCYLLVKHRNHLTAMSAQPLVFTNILTTYDFTTGPDKFYGGTNACVQLEPGVWGMIGGDADGDGKITPVDRAIVEQQKGKTGYLSGDLNLDGKVDGGD